VRFEVAGLFGGDYLLGNRGLLLAGGHGSAPVEQAAIVNPGLFGVGQREKSGGEKAILAFQPVPDKIRSGLLRLCVRRRVVPRADRRVASEVCAFEHSG
jgi:hypothetical protein